MICGFKKNKQCTAACQYYATCTRKIDENAKESIPEVSKDKVWNEQECQDKNKTIRIAEFEEWALNKGYKEVTIKGFISAINSIDRFDAVKLVCDSIWSINDMEKIVEAISTIKSDPNYVNSSRTHYGYSLNTYRKFVQDVTEVNMSESATDVYEDVLFGDAEEDRVKRLLMKFPNLGLYMRQICDTVGMEKEKVASILDKASWCSKEANRYYYNDKDDESWEETLFESDNDVEQVEANDLPTIEDEQIDEKVNLMNNDFDTFLKSLKAEKGIK